MTPRQLKTLQKQCGKSAEYICGEAGISLSTWHKFMRTGEIGQSTMKHLEYALNRILLDCIHEVENER